LRCIFHSEGGLPEVQFVHASVILPWNYSAFQYVF
jgi:hypothetical protein